jgi:hypothetical protein
MEDGLDVSRVALELGEGIAKNVQHNINKCLEEEVRGVDLLLEEADGTAEDKAKNVAAANVVGQTT